MKIINYLTIAIIMMLQTISSSAQWQLSGTFQSNVHSFTVSGNNIFAGVDLQGVYRSTDNGGSWNAMNTGLTDTMITALASSLTRIYSGTHDYTDSGGVFLSINQGFSWSAANTGLTNKDIVSLDISGTNVLAGTSGSFSGDTGKIFLSVDSGANWSEVFAGNQSTAITAFVTDGQDAFAGALPSGLFYSPNNGMNWVIRPVSAAVSCLAKIDTVLFVGTSSSIYLSYDTGFSLISVPSSSAKAFAVSGQNIFAGNAAGVWLSTNLGNTWQQVNNGLPLNTGIISFAANGTTLFAATDSLQIWKRPLSEFTTSLNDVQEESFSIAITPNPFTSTASLTIRRAENKNLQYILYDLLGRAVSCSEITGSQTIINRNHLPPGIYFLKVSDHHSLSLTEKIVIQ